MSDRTGKILVVVFIVLAAAGVALLRGERKSNEIVFWGGWTGPDAPFMQRIVDMYNKGRKGLPVTLTTYQWDAMFNKLVMSAGAGAPPDIIAMHQTDIPQFAAMGVLTPMDDWLKEAGLKPEDFEGAAWEGFKYKGKIYAMPLDIHMFGMYYNTDMFRKAGLDPDRPPRDRASLLAAARKLTIRDKSGKVAQYGIGVPATHQHAYRYWYSLLRQNGGAFLNAEGGAARFDSSKGVEAYQFLHDLVYRYKVAPEQEENVAKDFQAQKVAMVFEGPWWAPGFAATPDLHYAVAPFPRVFARRAVWANSHGLSIPARRNMPPERRGEILKVLKFISDNSIVWGEGGQIPVRRSVLKSARFRALPWVKPFLDSVPHAVYLPKLEKGSLIFATNSANAPMMIAMEEVMLNQNTPRAALDAAAKQVNDILKR